VDTGFRKKIMLQQPPFATHAPRDVGHQQRRSKMNTLLAKFLGAIGLAAVLAVTAVTSSYAQRHDPNCIPQYDTSGAQVAPYC
jgi:hypothetical protein